MNFFRKPSPQEQMKAQQKDLRKAARDVDRSKREMERQEKQLEIDIKKAAKEGNKQACNILAKQLVQLRKQKSRCLVANSQIGAISNQSKVMQANTKLAGAMATSAKTLANVNAQTNTGQIIKTMQDFERENTKMEMKEELIDETLNAILDNSGDEAEEDAVISQVLDEIGIEITGKLAEAPVARGAIGAGSSKAKDKQMTDEELEAQLARLKT
ncbi:charged multivesicular body protein 2b-like [Panonychus citri]|uniref:charged multivesicular body protein 2b-like n=1 Tax=Panonychus citri TaxID=50023 RepID=UPI0023071F09|nr:charged multivesicular body protein 2b-like [Panonychus citri]